MPKIIYRYGEKYACNRHTFYVIFCPMRIYVSDGTILHFVNAKFLRSPTNQQRVLESEERSGTNRSALNTSDDHITKFILFFI